MRNIKRILNLGILVPVILFIIMALPAKLWANDPYGIIFDSVSNQPIDGATITLERYITETSSWELAVVGTDVISPVGVTNPQISGWTGITGEYQYIIALGGYVTKTCRLKVSGLSPGYVFPSTLSIAEVITNCPGRHLGDNTGATPPEDDATSSWGAQFDVTADDNWWIDIPVNIPDYTSVSDGNWTDPTTWDPPGVPTTNNNVTITNYTVLISGTANAEGIIITSNGILRLDGPAQVITLTLNGSLYVGGANPGETGALELSPQSTLLFNCASAGQYGLIVDAYGTLTATGTSAVLKDCLISSVDTSKEGYIYLKSGSESTFQYCELSYLGHTTVAPKTGLYADGIDGSQPNQGLVVDTCNSHYNCYGILLSGCANVNVISNTCSGNVDGIRFDSSSTNILSGNICSNNANYGIYLYSSSANTLTENTCLNNAKSGIYIKSSSGNTLGTNTCSNNTQKGIYLITISNDNTLSGNTCSGNGDSGIYLYNSCNNNTLSGNTCPGNSHMGIMLTANSRNNTLSGNNSSGNGYGIYLSADARNNTLSGNTCSGNSSYGIFVYESHTNTLSGNTCSGPGQKGGILLSNNSYDNTLSGNTCLNNSWYGGIYLKFSSNNNNLSGNICSGNKYGIHLDSSSANTITGNTCSTNTQYGFYVTGTTGNLSLSNEKYYGNTVRHMSIEITGSREISGCFFGNSAQYDVYVNIGAGNIITMTNYTNDDPGTKDAENGTPAGTSGVVVWEGVYQPDNQIALNPAWTDIVGNTIYNLDGTNQTKSLNINNSQPATYYVRMENDGAGNDVFTATGTIGGSGWTISYYDALTGGTDISVAVVGNGWNTGSLATAGSKEIRIEVTPDITLPFGATKNILITATSTTDPAKKDVVKATAICVSGANLVMAAGANNPATSNELKGTAKLPMLQLNLSVPNGYEAVKVNSVELTASGTVNDASDISAVRLILDANNNGLYDTGETVLAGPSTYSSDNGTITMTLGTPRTISIGTNEDWLVVYNLAGTASLGETLSVGIDANTAISAVGAATGFTITPSGAPVAGNTKTISDISASVTSGTAPLQVGFASQFGTGGTVVQYEWDFDYDGVTFRPDFTSNLTGDANFTYEMAGTYTARLRVTYADGTVIERTVEITVSAPGDAPSITGINTATTSGPAPLTITFTMIATPGTGQIEAYFWDFDGDEVIDFTSTTTNTALYTYTQAGSYTVTGKVQDSEGLMAKDNLVITVNAPLSTPPTANIITPTNPTTITVGKSILFQGSGITGADGTIVKYEWDLDGDGSIDYGSIITATTSYIYLQTGTVTVTLRVTEEPSGLTGEDTVTITVEPSPLPRVAIKQPGIHVPGKDGLRRTVKGKITVKAVSVPIPATQTLDLRYRQVGGALPDTFTSPADDPPVPSDAAWQIAALDKSTFNTADAGAEGFITRLDTSGLLDDNWYEIIAIANYNPGTGTYDAWNAGQTNKRVFIYIEPTDPELDEDENQQKTKVKKDKSNETNSQGQVDVSIPYEGVTTDTDLTIGTPGSIPPMGGLDFIDNYKEISLSNNARLCKPARIKITYPDMDDDDTVDGTAILETTLIMYRYDETDNKWERLPGQIIDRDNNIIHANAPAFSIFGMAGTPASIGDVSTGSSGHDSPQAWYKPWRACGLLGLEALMFLFIMGLLRKSNKRTSNLNK